MLHLPAPHVVVPAARDQDVARGTPRQVLDAVVDGLADRVVVVGVRVPAGLCRLPERHVEVLERFRMDDALRGPRAVLVQ